MKLEKIRLDQTQRAQTLEEEAREAEQKVITWPQALASAPAVAVWIMITRCSACRRWKRRPGKPSKKCTSFGAYFLARACARAHVETAHGR